MNKTIVRIVAVAAFAFSALTSHTTARADKEQYISVLGNLNVGTELYDKRTHRFVGIVKDITWGKVEVDGDTVSAATQTFSRSEITSNYVTKAKR